MSVTPTESSTGMAAIFGTQASGVQATGTTKNDKDMFLQLLVAQMKYQDPMNPTDSSQFLAQTAQFTALEKMTEVAELSQQLLASQMAFGAQAMVGQKITYLDADGTTTKTGTVDGVSFTGAGPLLSIAGEQISLGQVLSTGEAPAPTPPPTTTDTSTSTTDTSTTARTATSIA